MTIERKVTSSSRKASDSTKANTIGARALTRSLKSFVPAAMPVTYALLTPGAAPTVWSTIPPRRADSALADDWSVPSPRIGIEIDATCLSALTSTLSGPFIVPRGEGAVAHLLHRGLDLRRGHVLGLDGHHGRDLPAGEGGLLAVVDLHDLELARQVVGAGEDRVHPEGRQREHDQDAG